MAIQYYGKLPASPITCSRGGTHTSNYGSYISRIYSYNGHTFNTLSSTVWGSADAGFYGGFGYFLQDVTGDSLQRSTRLSEYISYHGLTSSVDESVAGETGFAKICAEIDAGYPVVVLTSLTTLGHYITCIGYVQGQHTLIFNDSYGNKGSGYPNANGAGAKYDWPGYNNGYPNLNTVFRIIYARGSNQTQQPAMSLTYNGTPIPNGDTSPSTAKGTDFGTTSAGLTIGPRTFTISNTGNGALNLTGVPRVQFSGNNPSDFGMTAQPSTPVGANGGSTTFQLVFQPTANTGLRTATVSIANDDPNKNPYTFTVQGTAQVQQRIDPSLEYNGVTINNPDQSPTVTKGTDFSSVNVGSQSATHSFQFYNFGTINMTLSGSIVQLTGANAGDFSIASMPSSPIAAGQYSTIGINFQPTGSGLRTATMLIYFDATYAIGMTSPYTVSLQGTGLADTTPPALTIGSPLNNAIVTSASLPVSGTASDSGYGNNGISSVTVNGIAANNDTVSGSGTANWSATVSLHSGPNTITVIATDGVGNATSPQQRTVTYNPPRPVFGGSSVSSGQLQTTLSGLSVGETVVLYSSTDLKNWTLVQTKVATGSTVTFTPAINSALGGQYFRVQVQ
jgi:hypothetical protein